MRADKLAKWQARKSCADCKHWYWETNTQTDPGNAGCGLVNLSYMCAPADHYCGDWEAAP